MKRLLFLSSLLIYTFAVTAQSNKIEAVISDGILQRISESDTLFIMNFWATWCIPCVKELPDLEKINDYYHDQKVKVLLISLDFKDSYPDKLQDFVQRQQIKSEVLWLNETNGNEFIPKFNDAWSGAIPATYIINKNINIDHFIEGKVNFEQLSNLINQLSVSK